MRRCGTVAAERFLYLIGDYEPLRYPAGTFAALAAESYSFPHFALFSSELLRDYFRRHGIGVYGSAAGDRTSAVFEEAVTVAPPTRRGSLPARATAALPRRAGARGRARDVRARRARARRALEHGAFAGEWTLHAVGTGRSGRRLDLGGGEWMHLLPTSAAADSGALMRSSDVGLAPMHAPQPGLVPIEMARAGMLAVTTTYEHKDAGALAAISPNLVAAEPTVDGIAAALAAAAAGARDADRRLRGSAVRWSLDWDSSFDDELLDRLTGFLRG